MVSFSYTIQGVQGLHARPVVEVARVSGGCESTVTISCKGTQTAGNDMMGLMALNAGRGDELAITVDGPDERAVVDALKAVLTF